LRERNPAEFDSFNPGQVLDHGQQQAHRIQNEKMDAVRKQFACVQEPRHGDLQVVTIGRYPGMGPIPVEESHWDVVWFALVILVAVYTIPALFLAAVGLRGRLLVLGSAVVGAPLLMAVLGVVVSWKTRMEPSPLTNAKRLHCLVNRHANEVV
jgi:hypothetical protein